METVGVVSLWAAVSGWRVEMCLGDVMPDLHLGVARDTIATALVSMAGDGLLGPDLERGLRLLT
eukprot:9903031-Alexandrium_andersonii.AAC.1